MTRARLVSAAMLSAFVLLVAGCHRETTRVARQPPPPSWNANGRPNNNPGRSTPDAVTTVPVPQPDVHGRPVSTETGLASWYGPPYSGRKGADGTVYDQNAMTAAHLTLPLGTLVRVTNLTTNQSVVVRITDRGPFVRGRIIDLSLAAAKAAGVYRAGVAKVRVDAFAPDRANPEPAGRWCVQVGAFSKEKDAIKLKDQLSRRYTTAKVIEFAGPTGHWVRINPLTPDKAHATQVAESIRTPDPAALPYVVRTN
ncbi:MAG: septal ring lytic transglycosylase RlpA family protein [Edaphobacter sp.]